MKYLLLLLAILSLSPAYAGSVELAEEATHALTRNGIPTCTAVSVAPNVLLTATHCVAKLEGLLVDGKPTKLRLLSSDGNDHSLIFTSRAFRTYARISADSPPRTRVYSFGFAAGNPYVLYREGYNVGKVPNPQGVVYDMWDIEGYKGDSGGALWNSRGEVVATFAIIYFSNDSHYRLIGTLPYNFTEEQIRGAGIEHGEGLRKRKAG